MMSAMHVLRAPPLHAHLRARHGSNAIYILRNNMRIHHQVQHQPVPAHASARPSTHSNFLRRGFATAGQQGSKQRGAKAQSNQTKQPLNPLTTEAKGPVSWRGLVLTGLGVGTLLGAFLRLKAEKDRKFKENQSKHTGKARIGGPWAMVNHLGKPVTSADFHGKFQLVYFGFTNCPDVCPAEMKRLGAVVDAVDGLPDVQNMLQPLFVSVDPARDSVAEIAEYVADYHPKTIGVVGTPEQVERMCKQFRVFFHKASELSEDDYLIDHSIIMYLMDRNGEFVDFFGTNMTLEDVKTKVIGHLRKAAGSESERPWWKIVLGLE